MPIPDAEDVSVHLRPILGIRPGAYLAFIYGLAALLIVFFLFFYPGIRHRGAYVSFTTFPDQATIKVDGTYAGSTPCTIFLKRGERRVEISKPHYAAVSLTEKIRGRVFATLFVPDRSRRSHQLDVGDVDDLLRWAIADFQKNPQIPRIISDAAWAVRGDTSGDKLYSFMQKALSFVTDETQLREMILGAARVSTGASFLTPSSFVALLQRTLQLTKSYDNLPAWLLLSLSKPHQDLLGKSTWAKTYLDTYSSAITRYYRAGVSAAGSAGGVSVSGMSFRAVPAGDLTMGRDDSPNTLGKSIDRLLLHPVRVDAFYLGATEVTNGAYLAFVQENRDWAPENTQPLVDKGLVTDTYLSGWVAGRPPAGSEILPVTSVSWNAAVAYCEWLTRKVQSVLPGYDARLPLESEWEWAARGGLRGMPYPLGANPGSAVFMQKGITGPSPVGTSEPNGYGLRDMIGNVWEWCADPFTFTSYLLTSLDPRVNAGLERALPDGPDRAARGGGWGNQQGTDKVYTRGAQPADWCTPYLGFRVALARR